MLAWAQCGGCWTRPAEAVIVVTETEGPPGEQETPEVEAPLENSEPTDVLREELDKLEPLEPCLLSPLTEEATTRSHSEVTNPSERFAIPVTPNSFGSQHCVRKGRHLNRSVSTECLCSGNVEWWVIRPPQSPLVDGNDRLVTPHSNSHLSEIEDPPDALRPTWCGEVAPEPEDTAMTNACQRGCFSGVRRKAAGERYRYEWNGFDLDLAYITSRVIAMGFPSQGHRAAFRNPQSEVERFLRTKHGDHFRIYNLCDEKAYASNGFPNETVHFSCTDHCPPPLGVMRDFCQNVEAWLRADEGNIVSVHCKAGKGRTGCMICALLVYAGAFDSTYQALRWYEQTRGGKRSGVTIPDQIRWVAMLERYLQVGSENLLMNDALSFTAPPHRLLSLRMGPFSSGPVEITATVGFASRESMASKKKNNWLPKVRLHVDACSQADLLKGHKGGPVWTDSEGVLLVRLQLPAGKLQLRVWWHYAFLQTSPDGLMLHVTKEWIGGLQKDVMKNKLVLKRFSMLASFEGIPSEES